MGILEWVIVPQAVDKLNKVSTKKWSLVNQFQGHHWLVPEMGQQSGGYFAMLVLVENGWRENDNKLFSRVSIQGRMGIGKQMQRRPGLLVHLTFLS